MMNVVAIMGRLTADPVIRTTTSGKNVVSFTIACDRGRRDANGQNQADFINVVAWEHVADFVSKYFQKGSMIAVDGRLQSRNYQDRNGQNRTAIEVVANNVNFAGSRPQNQQQGGYPAQQQPAQQYAEPVQAAPQYAQVAAQQDFSAIEDEGDLPF